jgi:ABC-type Na+ efflux pump permease subunit
MRRVWLIARKDLKEAFGQKAFLARGALTSGLLSVFYGVFIGIALRKYQANPHDATTLGGMVALFGAMVALLGTLGGAMIAAQSVALERAQHTIESLLATPVTDREVFTGKALAAFLAAVVGGYVSGLVYYGLARGVSSLDPLVFAPVRFAVIFVAVVLPIVAAIQASVGVIVSTRCGSVTSATQISALLGMPIVGGVVYAGYRAAGHPWWGWCLLGAGVVALLVALVFAGVKALGREEIIARLD